MFGAVHLEVMLIMRCVLHEFARCSGWLDAFDAHAMQSALWGDADNELGAARICKGNAVLVAAVTEIH